jgi:hypothetical protein
MVGFHSSDFILLLSQLSYAVPVALLPGVMYNVLDVWGWLSVNRSFSGRVSLVSAIRIHLASEAVARTVPAGMPLSDSIRSYLLRREYEVAALDGLSMAFSRRLHLGVAQGSLLIIGGMLTFTVLTGISSELFHFGAVRWIPLTTGIALVVLPCLVLAIANSSRLRVILHGLMQVIPHHAMRAHLERIKGRSVRGYGHLRTWKSVSVASLLWFFAYWCAEMVETYLFVVLLGIPATAKQVVAIEVVVSSLKVVGFFMPSGIGVQDIGYASMLASLGCVPSALDASGFVLLKRGKDVFWIVVGYAILVSKGIRPVRKQMAVQPG